MNIFYLQIIKMANNIYILTIDCQREDPSYKNKNHKKIRTIGIRHELLFHSTDELNNYFIEFLTKWMLSDNYRYIFDKYFFRNRGIESPTDLKKISIFDLPMGQAIDICDDRLFNICILTIKYNVYDKNPQIPPPDKILDFFEKN